MKEMNISDQGTDGKWFSPFSYNEAISKIVKESCYSESKVKRYIRMTLLPECIQYKIDAGLIPSSLNYGTLDDETFSTFDKIIDTFTVTDDEDRYCLLGREDCNTIISALKNHTLIIDDQSDISTLVGNLLGKKIVAKQHVTKENVVREIKSSNANVLKIERLSETASSIRFSKRLITSLSEDDKTAMKNKIAETVSKLQELKSML
jgi:hypothetical protein